MSKPLRSKNHPSEKLFKRISELVVQNLRLREYLLELDKELDSNQEGENYLQKRRQLTRVEEHRSELNHLLIQHGITIR